MTEKTNDGAPGPGHGRGRPFAKGNPGRKPGSRNRSSVLRSALLNGEEDALLRKAVAIAKAGDGSMLKFFLGRIMPRERVIEFDMPPMHYADDAVDTLGAIIRAVAQAKISPAEAAALAQLVDAYSRAIQNADVLVELDSIKEALKQATLLGSAPSGPKSR